MSARLDALKILSQTPPPKDEKKTSVHLINSKLRSLAKEKKDGER